MAQKKISQLPQDLSPTVTDSIPTYDVETSLTKRSLISDLITLFFNNIPAGAHSDITRGSETIFDHVASGGVITADSVGVNKNASMTALVCYINGRRISISAVTSRTYAASVDTYVDVLDNLDGTGTLVYTTAVNNAASPALASNSLRIGIVVSGATTIAAATSINQGQESRVLPIASSIPYTVTDSLGNLICPRDPNRKILGYRQVTSSLTTASATAVQATGLSCPVIVPTNRKVRTSAYSQQMTNTLAVSASYLSIWDGVVASGTQVAISQNIDGATSVGTGVGPGTPSAIITPAATSKTYNAGITSSGGGTATLTAATTSPGYILVELV